MCVQRYFRILHHVEVVAALENLHLQQGDPLRETHLVSSRLHSRVETSRAESMRVKCNLHLIKDCRLIKHSALQQTNLLTNLLLLLIFLFKSEWVGRRLCPILDFLMHFV